MNRKILMTTDAVGGVWTYALELCRALPKIDFMLANMGPLPSPDQWREVLRLPNVDIIEGAFKLEWSEDPWRDLERAGDWLLGMETRVRPDLIHLNGYVHAALPWRGPVLVAAHSCMLSWWKAAKGEPPPESLDRYAAAVQSGLHACQQIVAPSRAMAASLVKNYGVSEPLVIPNGRFVDAPDALGVKEPFVLCAARLWDEAKNAVNLTQAAAGLAWPLVLAGDAGANGHVFKNVRMAGRCSRRAMDSWFRRAAIYAHPARYEPFGLAPLEAAQSSCALVLADIPSLREIWGDAAEFVAPGDPLAWRRTLQGLISDRPAREALAARASARAEHYTPQRMAASYLAVYCGLLDAARTQFPAAQ
jgi:glycosyltransferase involved in cell wall biosynthesis